MIGVTTGADTIDGGLGNDVIYADDGDDSLLYLEQFLTRGLYVAKIDKILLSFPDPVQKPQFRKIPPNIRNDCCENVSQSAAILSCRPGTVAGPGHG